MCVLGLLVSIKQALWIPWGLHGEAAAAKFPAYWRRFSVFVMFLPKGAVAAWIPKVDLPQGVPDYIGCLDNK